MVVTKVGVNLTQFNVVLPGVIVPNTLLLQAQNGPLVTFQPHTLSHNKLDWLPGGRCRHVQACSGCRTV